MVTEAKSMQMRREEEEKAIVMGSVCIVWCAKWGAWILPGGGQTQSEKRAHEVARVMYEVSIGKRPAPGIIFRPPPPLKEFEATPEERTISAAKVGGKGSAHRRMANVTTLNMRAEHRQNAV